MVRIAKPHVFYSAFRQFVVIKQRLNAPIHRRRGGTCGVRQLNYRAASPWTGADRPSATAGVGQFF